MHLQSDMACAKSGLFPHCKGKEFVAKDEEVGSNRKFRERVNPLTGLLCHLGSYFTILILQWGDGLRTAVQPFLKESWSVESNEKVKTRGITNNHGQGSGCFHSKQSQAWLAGQITFTCENFTKKIHFFLFTIPYISPSVCNCFDKPAG